MLTNVDFVRISEWINVYCKKNLISVVLNFRGLLNIFKFGVYDIPWLKIVKKILCKLYNF